MPGLGVVCVSAIIMVNSLLFGEMDANPAFQTVQHVPYKGRGGLIELATVFKLMAPLNGRHCGLPWVSLTPRLFLKPL